MLVTTIFYRLYSSDFFFNDTNKSIEIILLNPANDLSYVRILIYKQTIWSTRSGGRCKHVGGAVVTYVVAFFLEYNESFKLAVDRKNRNFVRFCKRQALNLKVYYVR